MIKKQSQLEYTCQNWGKFPIEYNRIFTHKQSKLFIAISFHCQGKPDGECFASNATLAEESGLHPRDVSRVKQELLKLNALKVSRMLGQRPVLACIYPIDTKILTSPLGESPRGGLGESPRGGLGESPRAYKGNLKENNKGRAAPPSGPVLVGWEALKKRLSPSTFQELVNHYAGEDSRGVHSFNFEGLPPHLAALVRKNLRTA